MVREIEQHGQTQVKKHGTLPSAEDDRRMGPVTTAGTAEKGRPVTYSLTELGREAQSLASMYPDLRVKTGAIAGILGIDKDIDDHLHFTPMVQIIRGKTLTLCKRL